MLRWLTLSLLCLPLTLLTACGTPREEGIIVNLQTDYVPALEFDHIRVEVDGSTARDVAVGSSDAFARPRFVTTYTTAPRGQRRITLTLLQASREVAQRTLEIPFEGNYLATVVITRSCSGISCIVGESCLGARCVPNACITGTEPACPPPSCTTDAMCTSATSCARGACSGGACLEVPTPGACTSEQACLPGTGCVSLIASDAPDAPPDASVIPSDAFSEAPSTVLYHLSSAASIWSAAIQFGDFPTAPVEAAFTASDGTLRVITRNEVFTMETRANEFSERTPRDTLFPELAGIPIEAADRVGNTLTFFHRAYTTYTWSDTAAPVFLATTTYNELPATWRGAFAPPTFQIHAFYSAPDNARGWAFPEPGAPCGVSGGYSEIISFTGIGPSALQEGTYSFDCNEFVARRDYGSSPAFALAGAPPTSSVVAITYANGLWVFVE